MKVIKSKKCSKKEIAKFESENANDISKLALSGFIIFIISLIAIVGSVLVGSAFAALLLPLLFADIGEKYSVFNNLANMIEGFEGQKGKMFRDFMVKGGNILNNYFSFFTLSPAFIKIPRDKDKNEFTTDGVLKLGKAYDDRKIQMFVFSIIVALFTLVITFFPPALPIAATLIVLYALSTLACRTADAAEQAQTSKKNLANALSLDINEQNTLLTELVRKGIETKFQLGRYLTASNISEYDNLSTDVKQICEDAKELYAQAEILAKELNTELDGILREVGYEDKDIEYEKIQLGNEENQKLLTILIDNGVKTKKDLREGMTDLRGILKKEGVNDRLLRTHCLIAELQIVEPSESKLLRQCFEKGLETKFQIGRHLSDSMKPLVDLSAEEEQICADAKKLYAQAKKLADNLNIGANVAHGNKKYDKEDQELLTILINNGVTTKDKLGKQMQTGLRGILVNAGVSDKALYKCESASNRAASAGIQRVTLSEPPEKADTSYRARELIESGVYTAYKQKEENEVAISMEHEKENTQSTSKAANRVMSSNPISRHDLGSVGDKMKTRQAVSKQTREKLGQILRNPEPKRRRRVKKKL